MANLRVRINIAAVLAKRREFDSLPVSFTVNKSRCSATRDGFRPWLSRGRGGTLADRIATLTPGKVERITPQRERPLERRSVSGGGPDSSDCKQPLTQVNERTLG